MVARDYFVREPDDSLQDGGERSFISNLLHWTGILRRIYVKIKPQLLLFTDSWLEGAVQMKIGKKLK